MENFKNHNAKTHIYNKHELEEKAKRLSNLNEESELITETKECHEIPPMVTQTTVSSDNLNATEQNMTLSNKNNQGEFNDKPSKILTNTNNKKDK